MQVNYGPYTRYFLWSLVLGIGFALIYDILRLFRKVIKTNDFVVNLQDIIFIMLSGGGVVCTAYLANNGEIRLYGIISSVLGFALYRRIIGRRLVNVLFSVWKLICKGANLIMRVIMFPFSLAVRVIGKPIIITIGAATKKVKRKIRRKFVKMPK